MNEDGSREMKQKKNAYDVNGFSFGLFHVCVCVCEAPENESIRPNVILGGWVAMRVKHRPYGAGNAHCLCAS